MKRWQRLLNYRERVFIELLYGLGNDGKKTPFEVAKAFHVTTAHVHWSTQKAIEKLKAAGLTIGDVIEGRAD